MCMLIITLYHYHVTILLQPDWYALYRAGLASSTLLTRPFIIFFVGGVGTSGMYAAVIILRV